MRRTVYPPSCLPSLPRFRKANLAAAPVFVLASTSKTLTTSATHDIVDTVIAQRISHVPGVGEVAIGRADQPLGIIIIGGLFVSQVLMIYLLMDRAPQRLAFRFPVCRQMR